MEERLVNYLESKIESQFYESDIEKELLELGYNIKWSDSGIDDGCDDNEEDDYIIYYSADITSLVDNKQRYSIKFYYGDITRYIGYIKYYP